LGQSPPEVPYNLDYAVILVVILSVIPLTLGKNEHEEVLAAVFFSGASRVMEIYACLCLQKKFLPLLAPGKGVKFNKVTPL